MRGIESLFKITNEGNIMNENLYAKITGLLFITATLAGLLSAIFLGSTLELTNYLDKVASMESDIYLVAFFELVMAFTVAGIAISMYPILKKFNPGLALGSVGFRILEGALFLVGTLFLLLLLIISKDFVSSGTNDAYFQTLGEIFKSNLPWTIGGISFTIGAFFYYIIFYQSKIIPRWLAIFGLLGVLCAFCSYFLQFIDFNLGDFEALLHFPIFIQEMVLAIWLIVKGYDLPSDFN